MTTNPNPPQSHTLGNVEVTFLNPDPTSFGQDGPAQIAANHRALVTLPGFIAAWDRGDQVRWRSLVWIGLAESATAGHEQHRKERVPSPRQRCAHHPSHRHVRRICFCIGSFLTVHLHRAADHISSHSPSEDEHLTVAIVSADGWALVPPKTGAKCHVYFDSSNHYTTFKVYEKNSRNISAGWQTAIADGANNPI